MTMFFVYLHLVFVFGDEVKTSIEPMENLEACRAVSQMAPQHLDGLHAATCVVLRVDDPRPHA